MRLALSPCPNDTFTFHALLNGRVTVPWPLETVFKDIQDLNGLALAGAADVVKISYSTVGRVLDDYVLLPVGSALGFGNGPKIVAGRPLSLGDLRRCRIAIPGRDTTAYLLLRALCPKPAEEISCRYDQIAGLIASGEVDAGLIIHETRFLMDRHGLQEVADVGELWQEKTGYPLPLGGVVARRALGPECLAAVAQAIRDSLAWAWENPAATETSMLDHSVEKDLSVVRSHVDLYVNRESWHLTPEGQGAVGKLLSLGREQGLMPEVAADRPLMIPEEPEIPPIHPYDRRTPWNAP